MSVIDLSPSLCPEAVAEFLIVLCGDNSSFNTNTHGLRWFAIQKMSDELLTLYREPFSNEAVLIKAQQTQKLWDSAATAAIVDGKMRGSKVTSKVSR